MTAENAPKLLTLVAYASLETGDREKARIAANQLKTVSTKAEDQARADGILRFLDSGRPNGGKPALAPADADATPPLLRHQEASPPEPTRTMVHRPSFTGRFVELRCGAETRILMETAEGRKLLLIDDPAKLLVNGKNGETMDLACGPQKPVQIRLEYDPPGPNVPGVDGLARAIQFEP